MFDIGFTELLLIAVVALIVLGPERLPQYAQQLARLVRELRRMAQGASEQVRAELGPEFDDIDWRKFDPRQYDPRRIVRDALAESFDPDDPLGLKDVTSTMTEVADEVTGNGHRGNGRASSAANGAAAVGQSTVGQSPAGQAPADEPPMPAAAPARAADYDDIT